MKNILIIDDERIGNVLEEILTKEGYCVLRAYSEREALIFTAGSKSDLILPDIIFQGLKGEEVLSEIKGIPVIAVNAIDDIDNKADELCAASGSVLIFDDIMLNTAAHTVTVNKNRINLTRTEYAILKLLMQNAWQVVKKPLILERIKEDTPDGMESSLKVHVSNLRKKIRAINDKDYIEAVWGEGFRLRI